MMPLFFNARYHVGNPTYTDKAYFPQAILETLVDTIPEQEMPHPLVFRGSKSGVYVGVKEFTGIDSRELTPDPLDESFTITVCQTLKDRLAVEREELELVVPAKAQSVKLRPLLAYDIFNYKFFLEAVLPKYYTTITTGQLLVVEHQGLRYELEVEEVNGSKDKITCSIVDADVELEINDGGRSTEFVEPSEVEVGATMTVDGVAITDAKFKPTVWAVKVEKPVMVKVGGGDVIASKSQFLALDRFMWTTMDSEQTKEILIVPVTSETIYLIGFSWDGGSVSISLKEPETISEMEDAEGILCTNCGRTVPTESFSLHQVHCQRTLKRCTDCGGSLHTNRPHFHCIKCKKYSEVPSFEIRHHKLYHEPAYYCNCEAHLSFTNYLDLSHHRATTCELNPVLCQFCHLVVPQGQSDYQDRYLGITHHENECGNKTTECFQCGSVIRVKDLSKHLRMHELDKKERQEALKFTKCSNNLCINKSDTKSTEFGLCGPCFGPLYSSVNDPDGTKLNNRIERKYMLQMSKGCGWSECTNEYCKMGKTIGESLTIWRETLKPEIPKFWFCVGESMTSKRIQVEELLHQGEYSSDMIYEGAQKSNAKQWLALNAVKEDI